MIRLLQQMLCRVLGHRPDAQGYGDISFKICKRCGKVYAVTLINPGARP